MTHETWHAAFFVAGFIYFIIALYFAFVNYRKTGHDGFWFFCILLSFFFSLTMLMGILWSLGMISDALNHFLYDLFFLIAVQFAFVAVYTLTKKHHEVRIF